MFAPLQMKTINIPLLQGGLVSEVDRELTDEAKLHPEESVAKGAPGTGDDWFQRGGSSLLSGLPA